jgi:hypothetical protein
MKMKRATPMMVDVPQSGGAARGPTCRALAEETRRLPRCVAMFLERRAAEHRREQAVGVNDIHFVHLCSSSDHLHRPASSSHHGQDLTVSLEVYA